MILGRTTSGAIKVKTDGGLRAVSCGCCEVECCMYPAQGLGGEFYTADNLPDNVTVDGTSFARSGTAYGNTTNGVIFEDDVWGKYANGTRSERPCLIQGGVEDEFASTYKVSSAYFSSWIDNVTVTRNSLCEWSGEATGTFDGGELPGETATIRAGITMNGTTWTVSMQSDCVFVSIANSLIQGDDDFKYSNTPVGDYGDGYHSNALSVTQ